MSYRISMLLDEIERFHIQRIFLRGVLGCPEIPVEFFSIVLKDSHRSSIDPHSQSPYSLAVPHPGIAVLSVRTHKGCNSGHVRGRVRMRGAAKPQASEGTRRSREMWRGRVPVNDAPLSERIVGRARRRLLACQP